MLKAFAPFSLLGTAGGGLHQADREESVSLLNRSQYNPSRAFSLRPLPRQSRKVAFAGGLCNEKKGLMICAGYADYRIAQREGNRG